MIFLGLSSLLGLHKWRNDAFFSGIHAAYKIFMPGVGINVTTRERADFRDNFVSVCATKMSAGVCTEVGGHATGDKGEGQFDIADDRSVDEIKEEIKKRGYNPVLKDWEPI